MFALTMRPRLRELDRRLAVQVQRAKRRRDWVLDAHEPFAAALVRVAERSLAGATE
jgi:hypothetical protein